jgi:hypothetical protein
MFCSQCGAQNTDDSLRCTSCGVQLRGIPGAAVLKEIGQSGALKGLVVLVVSFFTMPLRTIRRMVDMLRDVGARGAFDTEGSDVPHTSWLLTAGVVLIVVAMFVGLAYFLYEAVDSLKYLRRDVGRALGNFVLNLVLGLAAMVGVNWSGMLVLEQIGLAVGIANNVKKIASSR